MPMGLTGYGIIADIGAYLAACLLVVLIERWTRPPDDPRNPPPRETNPRRRS